MKFKPLTVLYLAWILLLPLTAQGKTDLPPEFGDRVPIYPGAQVVQTRYARDSVTVIFISTDAYGCVVDYYAKALGEKGWRIHPATEKQTDARQLRSTKDNVHLILSEKSETRGHGPGFAIQLKYPDGRE